MQINRSARGITVCGYRILPGSIRLGRRRKRRYLESRRRCEAAYQAGTIDAAQLQRAHDAALAITAHAETRAWFLRGPRRDLESTGGMESNRLGMSVGASAHRVIRGGSWNNDAQNVPRGVPQPQRALEPEQQPGLPLCRAHDGAGWLPPEQTGVLSVVSGDGEWLSTAGVLVAWRGRAGERSPVVSP